MSHSVDHNPGLDDMRIRCDGLSKTFVMPGVRIDALQGVSFSVERGTIFGLLGQNGTGKTTLMRLVSTILLPTAGTATVAGMDVQTHARGVRRILGLMTGDERSFYGRLTGRHNLDLFAALHGMRRRRRRQRIDELLSLLDLHRHADVPFQAYSAGTKQRLNLARALLHDPEVLLLDEPTRSMDVGMAETVHRFIGEELVGRRGKTILLASHDTREIEMLCARVAVLKGGRVVACGAPGELVAEQSNGVTYMFQLAPGAGRDEFTWLETVEHVQDVHTYRQQSGVVVLRVRIDRGHDAVAAQLWGRLIEVDCPVVRCQCETSSVRQALSRLADLEAETEAPQ